MDKKDKVVKGFRTRVVATETDVQLIDKDEKVLSDHEALALILNKLERLESGLL